MEFTSRPINKTSNARTKVIAVVLSAILVLSMTNIFAFATDGSSQSSTGPTSGAASAQEVNVDLDLQNSFVVVNGQTVVGAKVKVSANSDFVFTPQANSGFILSEVKATSASFGAVPIETDGETLIIRSVYIDDSLVITVPAIADTNAPSSPEGSTPLNSAPDGQSGEDAITPLNAGAKNGPTTPAANPDGTKSLQVAPTNATPEIIGGIPTITKFSGETVDTLYGVGSSGLDAVVVLVPRSPYVEITLKNAVDGVSTSYIKTSDLIAAGVAVDSAYAEYFVMAFDREGSGNSDFIQYPQLSFTFTNGSTPDEAIQPLEGYIYEGVIDSAHALIQGSRVAVSSTAVAVKAPASTSTIMKSDVEVITLAKTIKSISDGGFSASGIGGTLDSRPFSDTGNYSITYELALATDRNGLETGRLGIDGTFNIQDELTGFLAKGKPTQIKIDGPNGSTTISEADITAAAGTSFAFPVTAKLDSKGMVANGTYTVTVTYGKDAYTNVYPQTQTTNVLGSRQVITNSAWLNYKTKANTSVDTSATPSAQQNAIGYAQAAPGDIALQVKKQIRVKQTDYNYDEIQQAKYPENSDDENVLVGFKLTAIAGEGFINGQLPIAGNIKTSGIASLSGLTPNTTYTLTETQGIANFNDGIASDGVTVTTGALLNNKVSVTIDGKDYASEAYPVINEAQFDGTIEVSVTRQKNDLAAAGLGDYISVSKDAVKVVLYDAASGKAVASALTDANGNVKFENLDPAKEYTAKAETTIYKTTPNEASIKAANFDANKDATAAIQYTSTFGAMKISKKFVGANGSVVSSGLTANFTLTSKDNPSTTYSFSLNSQGEVSAAQLFNREIAPGNYTLTETSITGSTAAQYTKLSPQDVTIVAGEFSAFNQVLVNESNYGQIKIRNFDYGNTALTTGGFNYTLTYAGGSIGTTVPAGWSEVTIDVPAGVYTVTQNGSVSGFELATGSASVAVTARTAPSGTMTVAGTAPDFTIAGDAVQTAGFVYASLPSATGAKVNVQGKAESGSTLYTGLSGTKFALYKFEGGSYVYKSEVTSGASGSITVSNLNEGEYRLIEITATSGYALPAYAIALNAAATAKTAIAASDLDVAKAPVINIAKSNYSISSARETLKINTSGTPDANGLPAGSIPNAPFACPEITTISADNGSSVSGATFGLYKDNVLIGTATEASAKFQSGGKDIQLPAGEYTIKQTGVNADYMLRPDAVVKLTVDSKGFMTSSFDTSAEGGIAYARSETDGGKIEFSNAKKPAIKINKLGATNIFDETTNKRVEEPISGAVFEFYNVATTKGLVISDGKYVSEGTATPQVTKRGDTSVSRLDPSVTYSVKEISVPGIEDTDLGRITEKNIPNVSFEFSTKDGLITGYQIVGQTAEGALPVSVKDNTLTVHNPAESTYQIQVDKYALGTGSGALSVEQAFGVYDDCANVKFFIQKKVGGTWVTVETITTGTSSPDKANVALSSDLPAGEYRLVEIQSGVYSPAVGSNNSLYELTQSGADPMEELSWAKKVSATTTVNDAEGKQVNGLIWPGTIKLGTGGYADSNNPYKEIIGNDDERSKGAPWNPDALVQLHGVKKAIDVVWDKDQEGVSTEKVVGDVSGVNFELYFGYAQEKDGVYSVVGGMESLQRMSDIVSGSVEGEKGGFLTEFVNFNKLKDKSDPTSGTKLPIPDGAVPCFVLVEIGPVPEHLVQPTEDTNTTILPFELPNEIGKNFTIEADDVLPKAQGATGAAVIKNYEAEGILEINKYSSQELVDKNKKSKDWTKINEGIFNIYQVIKVGDIETMGPLLATIDLSKDSDVDILKGSYYIQEVASPKGYNPNGWYSIGDGNAQDFNYSLTGVIKVGEDETVKVNFFDTPLASLKVENWWNASQKTGVNAKYSLEYVSGGYKTAYESYSHSSPSGSAEGAIDFTVTNSAPTTLYNLPDGEYLIKELDISDPTTYHKNEKAATTGGGISVTISKGVVVSKAVQVTGDSGLREIDGVFYPGGSSTPAADNIKRVDVAATNTLPAVTTLQVNHMTKSTLAIKMGYIDASGITQEAPGSIAGTSFSIKNTVTNAVTTANWSSGELLVPLDAGIYEVTQGSTVASANTDTFTADTKPVYVQIGKSGTVTYLQNNTVEVDKDTPAQAIGKISASASPLVNGTANAGKYFYNKLNAGKVIVVKKDSVTKNVINTGAAFTANLQGASGAGVLASGLSGNGNYVFASLPTASDGTASLYDLVETTTPTGYYVDRSSISQSVVPNATTTLEVYNVPLTSIKVNKVAQMPTYVGADGNPVPGTTHPVEGLNLKLYKDGAEVPLSPAAVTDENGNYTFTSLVPGSYRVEEQNNLSYLNTAANAQYNSSNTSTHFEVQYTASALNGDKKVEIVAASQAPNIVDYRDNTIHIANAYKDASIFIPVMKIDEATKAKVEGAVFRLTDESGNALLSADNNAVIVAKTNDLGIAYFHFLPEKVYAPSSGSQEYTGEYYVKEINATDAYVISPYKSDYLKQVTFEGASQAANILVFENEKKANAPQLAVDKSVDADLNTTGQQTEAVAPLTQKEFTANYTIAPNFNGNKNVLPLMNYKVTDKGFAFSDTSSAAISDTRLEYTINSITVAQTVSADNQAIVASADEGTTWLDVSGAAGATLKLPDGTAKMNSTQTTPLFEVLYGVRNGESIEQVVGSGFTPGAITLNVTFHQFVMSKDAASSNDVASIINTVEVSAKHLVSNESQIAQTLTAQDSATITFPALPTLSINKELTSGTGSVRRGANVTYKVTLTNNSAAAIENPTIIDRPETISYGSRVDESMKVVLDDAGKPALNKVWLNGTETDKSTLTYQSFAWANSGTAGSGAVAAWVFDKALAPNESISIEFTVAIDAIVMADKITNTAYGTSLADYSDLTKEPTYYAKNNPTGAQFKPEDPLKVASNYDAINAITKLHGGIYVADSRENMLEVKQEAKSMKSISTDGVTWLDKAEVKPGESYYYRLQLYLQDVEGATPLKNVNIYELIPQNGSLGTGWTDELISLLQFSGLIVEGYNAAGNYVTFGSSDYDVYYSNASTYAGIEGITSSEVGATASHFNSFRLKMNSNYSLAPKQVLTLTYKIEVPAITDPVITENTQFSYADLEKNARQDGISNFKTAYDYSVLTNQSITSNTVKTHLVAAPTDLSGQVWDDKDRDGKILETDPAYTRDTVNYGDVSVVLYKDGIKCQTTTLDSAGKYVFTGLESSYGTGGPQYRVEFIYNQGSATYERPLTHVFTDKGIVPFDNGGVSGDSTNIVNTSVNTGSTAIVGDSGTVRLLHGVSTVNAGINAIPYTVTYNYGTAPSGASLLPNSAVYIYDDPITVDAQATAPGYSFEGWDSQDITSWVNTNTNFAMPPNNVALTGVWTAKGDTPYRVEYYFQNIGGGGYTINDAETLDRTGQTDTRATAPRRGFTGFTLNENAPGTILSANIDGRGTTVLKVYYDRNQYAVSYIYNGVVPTGVPGLPTMISYWYGQAVTIATAPSLNGFTFSGWTPSQNFTMPANNVTVVGSWEQVVLGAGTTEVQSSLPGIATMSIDDDGIPLALGKGIGCWVHWYILLGMLLTAVYGVSVIVRRKKFTKELSDFEERVLKEKSDKRRDESTQGLGGPAFEGTDV